MNSVDQIGRLGLDRAIEVLDGKQVEKDTVVESPQITTENAQEYIQKDTFQRLCRTGAAVTAPAAVRRNGH
ncbi:hypothetical protein SAMN05216276_1006205 [Streptosporangium subroseum]|uniref:Ribose transport system substrate-binding protein n=1 Tax=Streptosporangium subroseum TaxID=106412 RepID=A0A239D1F9_9ACTN|nr:hypothetical protein [Streptosporangium subroseum]SNS26170.1 hypothetical protein SAMN05216276_1006205 [Streptosporangium subroseum]